MQVAPTHSQPNPLAETRVSPGGTVSVTVVGPGQATEPTLVMVRVKVTCWPEATEEGWTSFLIARSHRPSSFLLPKLRFVCAGGTVTV